MKKLTRNKLEFLKKYAEESFQRWREEYSGELTGVHVGRRSKGGRRYRYYCIVFHVVEKKEEPLKKIPRYIEIDIPGEGLKKIPTDVIEVGELELLSIFVGDKICRKYNKTEGGIGVFLKKNGESYVCSNMHVLAHSLLKKGQYRYFKPRDQQVKTDVLLFNKQKNQVTDAFLEQAVFGVLDAAIARVNNRKVIQNWIWGHGAIRSFININWANYKNREVQMFGAVSGNKYGFIIDIGEVKTASIYRKPLSNLIEMTLHCRPGDSGSPIIDTKSKKMIGILVGKSGRFSYAIPIDKVLYYFRAKLL